MTATLGHINRIAKTLLPPYQGNKDLIKSDANTKDIVTQVLKAYELHRNDCRKLVALFGDKSDRQALYYRIWQYLRHYIRYKLDEEGTQATASPGAVEALNTSDCKALALYAACLLNAAGIPFRFRFAAYAPGPVTHVYVVTEDGTIIDPVYTSFNQQKPPHHITDFKMELYHISGVEGPGEAWTDFDPATATEAEMDLRLHLDRQLAKAEAAARVNGVGSIRAQLHQDAAEITRDLLKAYRRGDHAGMDRVVRQAERGMYDSAREATRAGVDGIGAVRDRRQAQRDKDKKQGRGNGPLQKVADKLKQGAALAVKAATAVPRLAAKGAIEVVIPKAGPAFLYLFINDPAVIQSLPADVRRKRDKAAKLHKFMTDKIGMKEKHLMGLYRNGIIKRLGKEPEEILKQWIKPGAVNGIGVITDIINAISEVIKFIKDKLGKGGGDDLSLGEKDLPGPGDWGEIQSNPARSKALDAAIRPKEDDVDAALKNTKESNPTGGATRGICSR